MTPKTYELGERNEEPWIKCLRCGAVSFNPHDIVARYCAGCHSWHEGSPRDAAPTAFDVLSVTMASCGCPMFGGAVTLVMHNGGCALIGRGNA